MENNFISREDLFSFLDRGIEKSIERHKLELTSPAQKYLVEMLEHFAETFGVEQDTWLTPITFQYQRVTEETNRMQKVQLQAEPRSVIGQRVKTLRKAGFVPAVVYGHDFKSLSIQVPVKELERVYAEAGESTVVYLNVNGQDHPTIIHDIVRDALRDKFLH